MNYLFGLLTLLWIGGNGILHAAPLTVSEDQRFLTEADGTPFLYLADTAWELIHRLDRADADHYLRTRAEQGFTVIQAVIISELNGVRSPNAYGELPLIDEDPRRPNPAYFEHVDFIVKRANELGLHMALLPTWGDKVESSRPGAGPVIFNPENASQYGRYLGQRYLQSDVIWIVGGDRPVETDGARATWNAMAQGLKAGSDGTHLVTFHPAGGASSAKYFHEAPWLDFNLYQSGHNHRFMPVHAFAERHVALQPRKPFIDGEPAYEDIPLSFWRHMDWKKYPRGISPDCLDHRGFLVDPECFEEGLFTDYDVRVHGYWNMLSGAAGFAYGNNAVWQMTTAGGSGPIPALTDWKRALRRPGAEDMRHLAEFFRSHPFHQLRPAQEIVSSENPAGENHIRAAIAQDRKQAVLYLAKGQTVDVLLEQIASEKVSASWFDPREGKRIPVDEIHSAKRARFTPPSSGPGHDWILILKASGDA